MTTIKDIDGETIYVDEIIVMNNKQALAGIIIAGLGMIIVLISVVMQSGILLALGVILAFAGGIVCTILNLYEGYIVRVLCGGEGIAIIKTTPEQDQIEICNAAKKLEQEARMLAEKKRNLERIASRCK